MPKKSVVNRSPTEVSEIEIPDVEVQVEIARALHAKLMLAAHRAMDIALRKVEQNPTLRDAAHILSVCVDKAEIIRRQIDALEGNNAHTLSSMARQLEGLARAQNELKEREKRQIDITPEDKDADADA
jgi:RNA polymerase-interacting CarD/CdnL/TRCF family regulator